MKTVVDMTGSGIGPRGSADVRIIREFPDLVGADIHSVDANFRSELRDRHPRRLDSINVTTVTVTKVPMLIAFYNPRYDDAEFPSRDYPEAQEIMNEFNLIYGIAEKWLKKSLNGVKLRDKFKEGMPYSYMNVAWDSIRKMWCIHINAGFRNLPENKGVNIPNYTNDASSYVEKFYADEEIDGITEDEVKQTFDELYLLIRNNKYIIDAQEVLRGKIREFDTRYLTKHSIFGDFASNPGFRGEIKIFTIGEDARYHTLTYSTAKEAFDKVTALTIDDILEFAKNNDLLLAPKPPEVKKTRDEQIADKKKRIAKMKKKTEVKFDDFFTDLQNLARKQ